MRGVPTSWSSAITLSNFGHVTFSSLAANDASPNLTESDRIVMVDSEGNMVANPSSPTGGDSFIVCFGSGTCP
jgi:hypothetical protein